MKNTPACQLLDDFEVLFQTFISQFFFLHAHLSVLTFNSYFFPKLFNFIHFRSFLGVFMKIGCFLHSSSFIFIFHHIYKINSFSLFIRSAKIRRFQRINKLKTERSLLICIRFIKILGLDFIEL